MSDAGTTLSLNFIRFPNNHYASYIIMKNGTAFRYLKNQTDKQREAFIKKFPVLPSYTPEAFYLSIHKYFNVQFSKKSLKGANFHTLSLVSTFLYLSALQPNFNNLPWTCP